MKVQDALLCLDCDSLFTAETHVNICCPECLSRTFKPLSGWIPSQAMAEKLREKAKEGRLAPIKYDFPVFDRAQGRQ